MPIEEKITEAIKRFTFNKNLPEFIDRAKYLEGRLKEGENLLLKVGESKFAIPTLDFIYYELHKTKGKSKRVLALDCLGKITYKVNFFKDYKPLLESQRA